MDELAVYREGLLSALKQVIRDLDIILTAIPSDAWYRPYRQDAYPPLYILAHLWELETQVYGLQLRRILDEDTPLLPLFDDSAWMASHYKSDQPAWMILADFTELRAQEINWLRHLPAASWNRTARHPWWGVRTFQWWVELQLDDSAQHLKLLTASLAI